MIASVVILFLVSLDGEISRWDGLIFIILYLFYFLNLQREEKVFEKAMRPQKLDIVWDIVSFVGGLTILIYASNVVIENAVDLSNTWNISQSLVGAVIIGLGTSLPELVVTINAAKKGKPEMAVGNVLGSNIFNTFAVMGIPAFFGELFVSSFIITFALPLMLLATFLCLFITQDKEITKWEGWFLIIFYIFFMGSMINLHI